MKIKMLPNWCKKVGLFVFLIGAIVSGYKGFMDGLTAECNPDATKYDIFENLYNDPVLHFFEVLSVIGMMLYMFSKEKVEDDYINILRLESYQFTILIGLALTVIIYMIWGNVSLKLDYIINLFMIFYLIIFAVKKRMY